MIAEATILALVAQHGTVKAAAAALGVEPGAVLAWVRPAKLQEARAQYRAKVDRDALDASIARHLALLDVAQERGQEQRARRHREAIQALRARKAKVGR